MNLNSRLFDRIRVKPDRKPAPRTDQVRCDHPGCKAIGEFRAPQGRLREGQYFNFCLDHVREYNASYNYFNGMSAEDVAVYQRDDAIGHRPTWAMGVNRSSKSFREDGDDPQQAQDPLGVLRNGGARARRAESRPRHGVAVLKALDQLGLDEMADAAAVKTRYKDLVKRLHPDANGGDRSSEDRLREIIRAYNYLRSVKFV